MASSICLPLWNCSGVWASAGDNTQTSAAASPARAAMIIGCALPLTPVDTARGDYAAARHPPRCGEAPHATKGRSLSCPEGERLGGQFRRAGQLAQTHILRLDLRRQWRAVGEVFGLLREPEPSQRDVQHDGPVFGSVFALRLTNAIRR